MIDLIHLTCISKMYMQTCIALKLILVKTQKFYNWRSVLKYTDQKLGGTQAGQTKQQNKNTRNRTDEREGTKRLKYTRGQSRTGETNQDNHKGGKRRERQEVTQQDTWGWTCQNKTGNNHSTKNPNYDQRSKIIHLPTHYFNSDVKNKSVLLQWTF